MHRAVPRRAVRCAAATHVAPRRALRAVGRARGTSAREPAREALRPE